MNSPFHWVEFNILVLIAIALDLGVFHRRPHKISIREALVWSGVWIGAAAADCFFKHGVPFDLL